MKSSLGHCALRRCRVRQACAQQCILGRLQTFFIMKVCILGIRLRERCMALSDWPWLKTNADSLACHEEQVTRYLAEQRQRIGRTRRSLRDNSAWGGGVSTIGSG